jgi:hypothetical protein
MRVVKGQIECYLALFCKNKYVMKCGLFIFIMKYNLNFNFYSQEKM